MKPQLFTIIKLISSILLSSAIGLELWNIHAGGFGSKIPSLLYPIVWIGRVAIAIHFIEALIAAFYAPSQQRKPIQYGIYTFFVGTVGLVELFDPGKAAIESNG